MRLSLILTISILAVISLQPVYGAWAQCMTYISHKSDECANDCSGDVIYSGAGLPDGWRYFGSDDEDKTCKKFTGYPCLEAHNKGLLNKTEILS